MVEAKAKELAILPFISKTKQKLFVFFVFFLCGKQE
jgi:hypothetical protein